MRTVKKAHEDLKGFEETLQFLSIEVVKQLQDACRVLDSPEECLKLSERIQAKDDCIDNMKNAIESKSGTYLEENKEISRNEIDYVRAAVVISANLEHIADHAVNISRQVKYLIDKQFMKNFNHSDYFEVIIPAINLIVKALKKKDVNLAMKICKAESEIDVLYASTLNDIITGLKSGGSAENSITALFIFQHLERVGDCILNIGEAVISVVFGERIKIHQFEALRHNSEDENMMMESVGETKSGNTIRKVFEKNGGNTKGVIFKEGIALKIEKEKESIEKWQKIMPGIAPAVLNFNKNGRNASIVLEYIKGSTIKDIIINGQMPAVKESLNAMTEKMGGIWQSTKETRPVKGCFIKQLMDRLEDVYAVHPEFKKGKSVIGRMETMSHEEVLKKAMEAENVLFAPFCVMLHGDCNADNIIYDTDRKKISYIDLHRSGAGDYVQDASVFIVSNYRMPFFDRDIRMKIDFVINEFFMFVSDFASKNQDKTFELRMAMALARSFMTSTRFQLDKDFSKAMYMKAFYLLKKAAEYSQKPESFRLPSGILEYWGN
ncbi:MAG: phosphotransferase [Candidatus Goldbacteria bacterium]|nr:phosphotransferase [Candidatus Goldiibacteriota bacterium]